MICFHEEHKPSLKIERGKIRLNQRVKLRLKFSNFSISKVSFTYGLLNSARVIPSSFIARSNREKRLDNFSSIFTSSSGVVEYFIRAAVYANKQSVCNSLRVIVSSRVVIFWHGSSVPLYLPFRHHNTRHRHLSHEYRGGACNSVPCLF